MDEARRIELLCTDDPQTVERVVEDLVAHGTAADWDTLVAGFRVEYGAVALLARGPAPLRPAETSGPAFIRRTATIVRLAAAAPDGGAAAAIRDTVRKVTLDAFAADTVLDVAPLAALPALRVLRVAGLGELRGLDAVVAAGRLGTLDLADIGLAELDLRPLRELHTLVLQRLPRLARLTGLPPTLHTLSLAELPALAAVDLGDADALRQLAVLAAPLPRPAAKLRHVQELTCDRYDQEWLTEQTSVTSARLTGVPGAAALNAMTGLRRLHLSGDVTGVVSAALTGAELEDVTFAEVTGAMPFAAFPPGSLPGVQRLGIAADATLTGLDGLAGLSGLTRAGITADGLTDLTAVAGWTRLKALRVHSSSLTDITLLAGLTRLRELDLGGCTSLRDLTPLAGLPLRKLKLNGVPVTRETIPEHLFPVVQPRWLLTVAPARPAAPQSTTRRPFARLKKLILTRDPELLQQGLELFRALEDADLAEAFLSGCLVHPTPLTNVRGTFVRSWGYPPGGWDVRTPLPATVDRVEPNALLAHSEVLRPYREAAIRGLVAYAPTGSPTADMLRDGLRTLLCTGLGGTAGFDHRIDLEPVGQLPGLRHLVLDHVRSLANAPALADVARPEELTLHNVGADLAGLAAPAVRTLTIADWIRKELPDLGGLPEVRRLWCEWIRGTVDVSALAALRSLRSVTLVGDAAGIGALAALEHLEELRLRNVTLTAGDLARLAEAPALTRLDLHRSTRLGGARLPPRLARIRVRPPA